MNRNHSQTFQKKAEKEKNIANWAILSNGSDEQKEKNR
jgi:hypothetical protein